MRGHSLMIVIVVVYLAITLCIGLLYTIALLYWF